MPSDEVTYRSLIIMNQMVICQSIYLTFQSFFIPALYINVTEGTKETEINI